MRRKSLIIGIIVGTFLLAGALALVLVIKDHKEKQAVEQAAKTSQIASYGVYLVESPSYMVISEQLVSKVKPETIENKPVQAVAGTYITLDGETAYYVSLDLAQILRRTLPDGEPEEVYAAPEEGAVAHVQTLAGKLYFLERTVDAVSLRCLDLVNNQTTTLVTTTAESEGTLQNFYVNGNGVYYATFTSGTLYEMPTAAFYKVDPAGGEPSKIDGFASEVFTPFALKNGWLYYNSQEKIWRLELKTGQNEELATSGNIIASAHYGGEWIYYYSYGEVENSAPGASDSADMTPPRLLERTNGTTVQTLGQAYGADYAGYWPIGIYGSTIYAETSGSTNADGSLPLKIHRLQFDAAGQRIEEVEIGSGLYPKL